MINFKIIKKNNCNLCVLKLTDYLLNANKCFVYSCKNSNLKCQFGFKFSYFKLLCCIFGFLLGFHTIYKFTIEIYTNETVSVLEIYMKLHMISCAFVIIGNSFLWNLKIKDCENCFVVAADLEISLPYPYEDRITSEKVLRSIIFNWIMLSVFSVVTVIELVFLEESHFYYKIVSVIYLNLFTCTFLEFRFILDYDLQSKRRYKTFILKTFKGQIENGQPGDHNKELRRLQKFYLIMSCYKDKFQEYISFSTPYIFVTMILTCVTYACMMLQMLFYFNEIPSETKITFLVYSIYGILVLSMAAQVVKAVDKLALFVSILLLKLYLRVFDT